MHQQLPLLGRQLVGRQRTYTVCLTVRTLTMVPTLSAASAFSCHRCSMELLLSEGLSKPREMYFIRRFFSRDYTAFWISLALKEMSTSSMMMPTGSFMA